MVLYLNYPTWITPEVLPFLPIRWYAIMYLVAFGITYLLFKYQVKNEKEINLNKDETIDLFMYMIIGLLLVAHLFSKLFYSDGWYYITHPWLIYWPFYNGHFVGLPGMSYHGGAVGAAIGGYIYCKKKKVPFLKVTDLLAIGIPFGYTFGRLGNFINAELYGRATASPIGMLFPNAEGFDSSLPWVQEIANKLDIEYIAGELINLPRHASQLYEAIFEGLVLGAIMWIIVRKYRKNMADGSCLSIYIFGYGFFRFIIEYFRQPDANIGYVIGDKTSNIAIFESIFNISKGQVFCSVMMAGGILLFIILNKGAKNAKHKRKNISSKR